MKFYSPMPDWVPISQLFRPGQHLGLDWACPVGTEVYAAADGWVRYGPVDEVGGYGNTITVQHQDGWESRYAHLKAFAPGVAYGAPIRAGQVVGWSGGQPGTPGAGLTTGPHLHSELRQHGVAVDPLPLYTQGGPAVGDQAQWEQDTRNIINTTLVGPGWGAAFIGGGNVLGQWEQDTRAIVGAMLLPIAQGVDALLRAQGLTREATALAEAFDSSVALATDDVALDPDASTD